MRAQIAEKLMDTCPEMDKLVYLYSAAKLEAALDIAMEKAKSTGVNHKDLPKETIAKMIDWSIRLAFGEHTQEADTAFFKKMLSENSSALKEV